MAGETTSIAASRRKFGPKASGPGLVPQLFTLTYATTQLETADVQEAGWIPGGVTVIGFAVKATDMDTATALVQKLTIGSTDVVTGITLGQTGAAAFYACTPYTTVFGVPEKLLVTCSTAAGTPAAGTLYVTPLYVNS